MVKANNTNPVEKNAVLKLAFLFCFLDGHLCRLAICTTILYKPVMNLAEQKRHIPDYISAWQPMSHPTVCILHTSSGSLHHTLALASAHNDPISTIAVYIGNSCRSQYIVRSLLKVGRRFHVGFVNLVGRWFCVFGAGRRNSVTK